MIELLHLEKKYENAEPLKDVSTVINDGDVISVIGPSGTGKSTLLRCINMLERPTGGQILLDGVDITAPGFDLTKARRKMGTGLYFLRKVGLEGRELQYPDQLSGGQKQRVAIARTLCMDPEVILFDEPTSALDPNMVGEVQSVIRDLAASGRTMMVVTHEMNFARAISSRVFYMDQGGIYEEGTPEQIFEAPARELTRRFIRKLKALEYDIADREFDFTGAGSELDRYCLQNDIPSRTKYRIRLAVEEIVQQILIPHGGVFPIHILIEYAPEARKADDKTEHIHHDWHFYQSNTGKHNTDH